jgi:hypothetical protein
VGPPGPAPGAGGTLKPPGRRGPARCRVECWYAPSNPGGPFFLAETPLAEPLWHLTFEPMPPVPGEPGPSVRVRRLLKFAARALRLRCVSLKEPPAPDPEAYSGWLWLPACGRWARVCCARTEEECKALLAERGPSEDCRVLPKGEVPQ